MRSHLRSDNRDFRRYDVKDFKWERVGSLPSPVELKLDRYSPKKLDRYRKMRPRRMPSVTASVRLEA
jgi:hypothetical protein